MDVSLNGKKTITDSKTISGLMKEMKINTIGKVIALNGKVIHWADYSKVSLKDKDKLEVKNFLGGG